jgi:hypothetical protein
MDVSNFISIKTIAFELRCKLTIRDFDIEKLLIVDTSFVRANRTVVFNNDISSTK